MTKNDKYIDIVQKLNYVAKAQQNLLSKISQTARLSQIFDSLKTIEPLMKELDKVNSLKLMLPQNTLNAPIIELTRQANLAISNLSISSQWKPFIEEASKISASWKRHIASITLASQLNEAILLGIQSQVARISEISLLAERSLTKIDFKKIGTLAQVSFALKDLIRNTHISFTESYSTLFKSLADRQLAILSCPPVVSTLPPVEFYYGNRFIEAISVRRKDTREDATLVQELTKETTNELEINLKLLDPSLIKLWRGANEALNSSNPDAIRHFTVSLRELLTHVIHKLSSDDDVKAWSTLPEHYHNNKPTIKARLLFICRYINYGPFSTFLEKDIDALLACIDIFQEGTHAIDAPLTMSQLELLKNRVGSSIRLVIRTWKDTREN